MLATTKKHARYWKSRNINWGEAYTSTLNHPHRQLIIDKLKDLKWISLIEVGCASGPNLLRIRQEFPKCEIGGIDINADAIKAAGENDRFWGIPSPRKQDEYFLLNTKEVRLFIQVFPDLDKKIKKIYRKWLLETRDIRNGIFVNDKGTDVILSDMTLIYIGSFAIKKVLKEIRRVARFHVIFLEFHSKSWLKRFWLWIRSGYWSYNWQRLLEKNGFYDIMVEKLGEKDWPGGNPQKEFAHLITARC